MLRAIVQGQSDPIVLADLARERLRAKVPQLREALCGEVQEHHRFLLGMLLEQVELLEGQIAKLSARIAEVLPPPFEEAISRLAEIPGISRNVLKKGERYRELGEDYLSRQQDKERLAKRLLKRLAELGVKVTVQRQEAVA